MAEIIVNVDIALSATMPELLTNDTYCWVDNSITSSLSLNVGDQIRIKRSATQYALYTITNAHDDTGTNKVRMGSAARSRLGTTSTFFATGSDSIFHPTYNEEEAESNSEYIEQTLDARINHWQDIVESIASVYNSIL